MKNFAKIMCLLMVLIVAFSINTYATDDIIDEPTTAVQQETTTNVAEPKEEATTQPTEEPTTQPEEELTTKPTEEPTTQPEEETTTEPEVTQPEAPTEPTEPAEPEIVLPKAPTEIKAGSEGFGYRYISWDSVEGADGYNVYLKKNGEWVYYSTINGTTEFIENLLSNSEYEVAVKSYKKVDGEKYESEEYCIGKFSTSASVQTTYLTLGATKNGVKLSWETCDGISGYRLFIKKDGEWVKITDINNPDTSTYLYKNVKKETKYQFAIRTFVKGTKGTKWGTRTSKTITYPDFTKAKITSTTPTNSAVTLNWEKVEGATGYRVYVYKNSKWTYYKGIKKTTYKVTGLEASTKYKFKVRAYYQANGKTTWGTYSKEVTVTTKAKTVKAYRLANYKKYFTDGDWVVTLGGLKSDMGFEYTMTVALKGDDIYVKYDYKEPLMPDIGYLIQVEKEKAYLINYKNKTYELLSDEEAFEPVVSLCAIVLVLDMENVKNVTAKTALYGGKAAITETYSDKLLGITKTYYFVNDTLKALEIQYNGGLTEKFTSVKISDTPSASYFKLPSGYKDFTRK